MTQLKRSIFYILKGVLQFWGELLSVWNISVKGNMYNLIILVWIMHNAKESSEKKEER